MDHRAHAPAVCPVADCPHMSDKLLPLLVIHPRSAVRMTGIIVTLIVSPVHDGHVRSRISLAFQHRQLRKPRVSDQTADIVHRFQHGRLIGGIHQIMKNRSRDNRKIIFFQFFRNNLRINRKIPVRSQFNCTVTGQMGLLQYLLPGRQVRIFRIIYALARRSAANTHLLLSACPKLFAINPVDSSVL